MTKKMGGSHMQQLYQDLVPRREQVPYFFLINFVRLGLDLNLKCNFPMTSHGNKSEMLMSVYEVMEGEVYLSMEEKFLTFCTHRMIPAREEIP